MFVRILFCVFFLLIFDTVFGKVTQKRVHVTSNDTDFSFGRLIVSLVKFFPTHGKKILKKKINKTVDGFVS